MVWTDYRVRVDEILKGDPRQDLVLSFAGGRLDGDGILVVGVPDLEVGATYLFFLRGGDLPYATPTVGWDQGIFRKVEVEYRQAVEEIFVSERGHPLEITEGKIRRGARIRLVEADGALPRLEEGGAEPRRDDESNPPPVLVDPRGEVVPLEAPKPSGAAVGVRSFASLSAIQEFAKGAIQEVDYDR